MLANILIVLDNLQYESLDYLVAIERHYKLNQIYKLSRDTKVAIDRFLSSVHVQIGYSTIIAWVAFGLSIVDGILFFVTCKHVREPRQVLVQETSTSLNNPSDDGEQLSTIPQTGRDASQACRILPAPLPTIRDSDEPDSSSLLRDHTVQRFVPQKYLTSDDV